MLKVADPWSPFVREAHQTASLEIPADVVTEQNRSARTSRWPSYCCQAPVTAACALLYTKD